LAEKRVLITGINGFAASHLADYIFKNNFGEVFGTIRGKSTNMENIAHTKDKIKISVADLRDYFALKKTIEETQPDFVFHLAAQSYVQASWPSPHDTMESNLIGTMNLFEAIRRSNINPRIQIAGSSEEYGLVLPSEAPIKETNPLRPLSPYGVSKVAADMLSYQYFKSYGMPIVRTRAFNHTGPRRGQVFVTSNWCYQVAMIEAKKQEPIIYHGNLEAKRDFTDVRDTVRAYWIAATKATPGEAYNICQNKTMSMKQMLEVILQFTKIKPKLEQDAARMRPSDVELLWGDNTKFSKETGWKPEIPFEKTMQDLLDYWREKIKKN